MKINHIQKKIIKFLEPIKIENKKKNKKFIKIFNNILKKPVYIKNNIQKKNNKIISNKEVNIKETELKKKQIDILIQINNKIIKTYEEIMNMPV
ncbi:flagellar hook-basal body complex protein FliE [Buchnera aphidicola]|uniref:Flagellar hook-basal body complex protein FliE n=1 Tax=Buchnera aphidicola (Cinara curvipes) TaxID=2518975 RepID=A0A451D661_9GAMM|nr:flagellar hook-basal body complex protein FliE [Buchnera aphidicola]VFP81341.1 Flagellar hook-basal body complex protein FliE [Buchnera aphidicola (Cinara curvipes)]